MAEPSKETCLGCVLPICDQDRGKTCRFVQITVDEHLEQRRDALRRQKREHQARIRAKRREELPELRLLFSRILDEYGTFGKHSKLIRSVRGTKCTR